ncbi:MAG TPA: 7-cyano-7-deazaguanine synthase QueC [Phycisphaerales bacterium]|nr:7-cyano-7-deazaguanine synthase QueC [Phycisphaerales bacterium]
MAIGAGEYGNGLAVVLLSGGLDSATVLAMARAEGFACHAMSFDYGQRHRHELAAAARVAEALGAAGHVVVPLDLRAFGGSALTADVAVPKGRDEGMMAQGGIPVTYVPARNMVFLSLAAGYAEVIGARDLFVGVNAVDYSGYPDCRPAFIESMERTINLATKAGVEAAARGGVWLRVRAPIVALSKGEIIRTGVALGVDYGLTHSCYDPVVRGGETLACGACDSCVLRRKGFEAAGVPDPTRYA